MSVPVGTYLVTASGRIRETTVGNDREWDCMLSGDEDSAQGGYLIGTGNQNIAPFSLTNSVTLSSPGSVEVDCLTSDPQQKVAAERIVMTAVKVDTLN
jgi:hypothetical protein